MLWAYKILILFVKRSSNLSFLNIFISKIIHKFNYLEIIGLRNRPQYEGEIDRYSYQSKYFDFDIKSEDKVLDVGNGAYPFPLATMLVDLYTEKTRHRSETLKTDGKLFKVADINHLPFEDKSFDFVYCSHVLEHVDDPHRACEELIRVGRRGYVEVPSFLTDALFAWAKGMHKWYIIRIADRLVFFEYDPRLVDGVRNPYWEKSIFSKKHHPLQDVFFDNMDIFNNGMIWNDYFNHTVFYLDGRVEQINHTIQDFQVDKA